MGTSDPRKRSRYVSLGCSPRSVTACEGQRWVLLSARACAHRRGLHCALWCQDSSVAHASARGALRLPSYQAQCSGAETAFCSLSARVRFVGVWGSHARNPSGGSAPTGAGFYVRPAGAGSRTASMIPVLFDSPQGVFCYQVIGVRLCCSKKMLVLEKCLQPKKPRWAERGEGCGASSTRCLVLSIRVRLLRA